MKTLSLFILSLFCTLQAHAAIVTANVTGEVTSADAGNVFGLDVGDTILLEVTFDDTPLTTNPTTDILFTGSAINTMNFTVGSLSFDDTMDTAGGVGPTLFFFAGDLSEIKFDTQFGSSGVFFSFIEFFEGRDDAGLGINGEWDLNSYTVTSVAPIPLPAAFWLFGSALLFLMRLKK